MPASYAYLGPEGTFTEVALRTLPEAATRQLIPYVSVQSALDAVRTGEAEAAFVPIENSVEGGITTTLDELVAGSPLMIYREVLLSITFALLVRPGTTLSDIKTVSAHPAAQSQVRNWLRAHLPDVDWESAASNADAARLVQEGRYDAAFAGEFAAARYGLEALETGIHDFPETAQTRFVLVGAAGCATCSASSPPGASTSCCCSPARPAPGSATTASASTPRGTSPTGGWRRR
jgi:prephenate dehydratase